MKKKILIFLIQMGILAIPISAEAYSDKILVGGDNIGLHIDSKGILVIGFYKVDGKFQKGSKEIKVGDLLTAEDWICPKEPNQQEVVYFVG